MAWKWYSARTLYRTRVAGRPRGVDPLYDADATMSEIRIVLLRARSFDEAIARAEVEAERYAAQEHPPNRYGQRVVQEYLGECDVFELSEAPGANVEVYSYTELVSDRVSDSEWIEARLGPEQRTPDTRRIKFIAAEYARQPSRQG
jgi:hypothetical protein